MHVICKLKISILYYEDNFYMLDTTLMSWNFAIFSLFLYCFYFFLKKPWWWTLSIHLSSFSSILIIFDLVHMILYLFFLFVVSRILFYFSLIRFISFLNKKVCYYILWSIIRLILFNNHEEIKYFIIEV